MPRRLILWASLAAISAALLAALLEAGGLVWFAVQEGGLFYTAEHPAPPPARQDLRYTVFRPYLGFGVRSGVPILRFHGGLAGARPYLVGGPTGPDGDPSTATPPPAWTQLRSNNFGFYSSSDFPVVEPDSFIVGVFGGSVAHHLAMQSGDRLAERLAALPALEGRRVRVLNFGAGGYKQPQQAVALTYFLLLGQRFDYVVNVDGFNEAALGGLNVQRGVDTSMPSVIHLRKLALMASTDPAALRTRLAAEELRAQREALERSRAGARFAAHYLLADLRLRWSTDRWVEIATRAKRPDAERGMLGLPSPLPAPGDHDRSREIADEWMRGSRLMAELARSVGADYLHVLQPNQYASGRRFSPAEARLALDARSPYAPHARRVYPILRQRGATLVDEGLAFADGSDLFDNVPDIVYADDCCHYNQRGDDRLADFVFRAMRQRIADGTSASD